MWFFIKAQEIFLDEGKLVVKQYAHFLKSKG